MELCPGDRVIQRQLVRARGQRGALARPGDAVRRRFADHRLGGTDGPRVSPPVSPFLRNFGIDMTTLLYTHPACLEHDPGPVPPSLIPAFITAFGLSGM